MQYHDNPAAQIKNKKEFKQIDILRFHLSKLGNFHSPALCIVWLGKGDFQKVSDGPETLDATSA
jgi:hypothetical protein